jgi:hypothetical protein
MTRLLHSHRIAVLALSLALVLACLGMPGLLSPAHSPSGPSTITHGTLVTGVAHALRADSTGLMQRALAIATLACALVFGAARMATPVFSPALSSAPGSFERPLRI